MKIRHELNHCLFTQQINELKGCSYNMKTKKYIYIQNGDIDAAKEKIFNEKNDLLFNEIRELSNNKIKDIIYHFVIASIQIAETCMEAGMGHEEAYTISEIYIRKADKCNDFDSIFKLYMEMELDFTKRMHEIKKQNVISIHIRKCIDYIYEHLNENLSVNHLAKTIGINSSYLSKLFLKETGINLKRFINNAKIDTAQNLLKYSDLSYLDISTALAFSSQSAFIDVFKKITGTTPKKYREYFKISN
ncbi:MAG: helix-turn-helix transcriptional regulator [Ruminococcus sp.]|nr:helix-turn-helix transcriptional regulator [Ruminococcus sp.]